MRYVYYTGGAFRGPFESEAAARRCFAEAPIMPGQRAWLMEGDIEIDVAYGEEIDDIDFDVVDDGEDQGGYGHG